MGQADITGDLLEVTIALGGGDTLIGVSTTSIGELLSLSPVRQTATGQNPVAALVEHQAPQIQMSANDLSQAVRDELLGVSNGVPPASGAQAPTFEVTLHDPNAADGTGDIVFPAVSFTLSREVDGEGSAEWTLIGTPLIASGETTAFKIGSGP